MLSAQSLRPTDHRVIAGQHEQDSYPKLNKKGLLFIAFVLFGVAGSGPALSEGFARGRLGTCRCRS